ncbi:hypothetical protein D6C91_05656 [Aureobasidium pullulans]|uniref:Uncharacterized protein n=1 Tax=Aureobasidium pullulans TaxID=5580 RepID=A0A4S9T2D4_AURPU|nr:hypothetical protein D6C91_05656 [Aureobasidium pullulans]
MENLKPKQLSTTRVCTLIRTKIVVWFWGQITFDSNKNILPSEDIMTEEQRQFSEHYPRFGRDALLERRRTWNGVLKGGLKALERLMEGEVQSGPRRINIEKVLVLKGPRFAAAEALEGVVSLLSHEVFGTFVRRLVFSAARVEERVTLLMAEIRERGLNRREARESIEGYDGAEVEKLRFLQSGAEGYAAHGGDQGERAQQTVSAPSPASLAPLTIGVPFADRATEPPIEKTDHALRAVVLTTADKCIIYALAEQDHGARRRTNSYWPASQSDLLPPADDDTPIDTRFQDPSKAIEVGAENHEHLVANIVNALQDKNLEHLYVPFAPEVQINVIAATFTILRALTSLKQSFSRHEHAFKVTNPGRANLGLMPLVYDRLDEDNCGLVFPEENISLDKLDLEAMTHLESRPPMLRELDLLGTFDLHQSPITTGRKVRPNKKAKAAGDNAEEDLIGTFIAWISQRGLVRSASHLILLHPTQHHILKT